MIIKIPRTEFTPHPIGRHLGTIVDVHDEGMHDSKWEGRVKRQHKISIRINSDTAQMENGQPFSIVEWFTVSSAPMSNLRKFRESVLDRSLTPTEESDFDPITELIGKRISYRVDQREKIDGSLRAVIRDGSVEPVSNGSNTDEESPLFGPSGAETAGNLTN